ncbi:hypothetical protein P775_07375 [Puniceibacterium antarcticum]|uniref:Uncharacterized protein n=1 Tax=Puniceibacterium antarcticum TaxID=1206336 RepID=A0A2G8RIF3_9RHOB|nr:DUF6481 family protein [Puniceibacterium antarcticum]PIL20858.1 hypothetical protein P775_07375 [Puniceibacterium antarcticum]
MRNPKENDFNGRRSAAADAKAALLQSHRAAKEAAEPTRIARQEERLAMAAAKEARQTKRARIKLEEQERVQTDALAADVAAKAEAETREKFQKDRSSRVVDDEAAQKAERDRRYADRKARKR